MGVIHRLLDDEDEASAQPIPGVNWAGQLDTAALSAARIVHNAPMVRRTRPNTVIGVLRQMQIGDGYQDTRGDPRRNRWSWCRAARDLGYTIQTVTADDGTLWIYRRK